jgi:hypothetical protein
MFLSPVKLSEATHVLFLGVLTLSMLACDESEIISYPEISIQPETLDFGQIPVDSSIGKELIITNRGLAELRLSSVKLPSRALAFSIRSVPGQFPAKDKKSILVSFNPQEIGSFSSTITISSNAREHALLKILVTGLAIPQISCGSCDTPPGARCLSDHDLLLFDGIGTCSSDQCRYASRVIRCEGQCTNGYCFGNRFPSVDVTLLPARPLTTDNLLANAVARDDDGDPITLRYVWFKDQQPVSNTDATVFALQTSKSEEWMVTVTANDGQVDGPRKTARVFIANTPPTLASAKIVPDSGDEQTVFSCVPSLPYDEDMDTISLETRWLVNSNYVRTSSSIDGRDFDSGDQIVCELTPHDGEAAGLSVRSSTVTTTNLAPSIVGATLSPSVVRTQTDLTVIPSGWFDPDGDPEDYLFEWYVNGMPIMGANAAVLGYQNFVRSDRVYARVTPTDGHLSGASILTRTATVQNTVPIYGLASVSPVAGDERTVFSCAPSGWFDGDGDAEQFDVSWMVNNSSPILGTNLDGTDFDRGDRIQCGATPFDAFDAGLVVWSSPLTIDNAEPSLSGADISPTSGDATTVFTCHGRGFTDSDNDPPGYQYLWHVNGVSSSTQAQIAHPQFGSRNVLYCEVWPDDGNGGIGTMVRSATVTISNTPPGVPTATVTPHNPISALDVTCSVLTPSIDIDNDPVSYRFSWTNGQTTVSGAVLPASATEIGQNWICTVTPNDGFVDGLSAYVAVNIGQNCWVDNATDILWSRAAAPTVVNAADAQSFCASLDQCGFSDWRVPSVLELRTIIDGCTATNVAGSCPLGTTCNASSCNQSSCNGCSWGSGPSAGGCYLESELVSDCSASYLSSTPDDDNSVQAWSVDFADGSISSEPVTNAQAVRCLRYPHQSCKEILAAGVDRGNGIYSIDTDGDGGRPPFNVYCDMTTDGGGWTAIISPSDQSRAYLERFDLLENTLTDDSIDATRGMTFGTTVPDVSEWLARPYRALVSFDYDEIKVTYSGTCDVPSDGLGLLYIGTENTSANAGNIIALLDTNGGDPAGQFLYVDGTNVFSSSTQAVVNRTDLVVVPGSTQLLIAMNGYLPHFPFTRRYIRELWLR